MKEYLGKEGFRQLVRLVRGEIQRKSNPNLLDNWYFVNPVNQRGQTEYEDTGYSIDRWSIEGPSKRIEIQPDCIQLSGSGAFMVQYYHASVVDSLWGRQITVSLAKKMEGGDIELISASGTMPASAPSAATRVAGINKDGSEIALYAYQSTNENRAARAQIWTNSAVSIIAAKLELGDHQTLAHQDADGNWVLNDPPPDYGTELAKCQRYQINLSPGSGVYNVGVGLADSASSAQIYVNLPVMLRNVPALNYTNAYLETAGHVGSSGVPVKTITVNTCSNNLIKLLCTVDSNSLTPGDAVSLHIRNSESFILDANL